MRKTNFCLPLIGIVLMAMALPTEATSLKVLHEFKGDPDGANPVAGLTFDTAGNLYGTTTAGGAGLGTVFKLTPSSDGTWTEKVLYRFKGGRDGANPYAGLIFDGAGNLYGTTANGGSAKCGGCGTVFKLAPNSNGGWTESVLYRFLGGSDGFAPSGLIFDAAGKNLYGTTVYGGNVCNGSPGCGIVFKLASNRNGSWTERVLYAFKSNGVDGTQPVAPLTFDIAGNLYGTTSTGGQSETCSSCGTIFKLTPNSGGSWTESVLYSFTGLGDGQYPQGELILDTAGNLYGTNIASENNGGGAVFKLDTNGGLSVVKHPGTYVYAGLVFDPEGNLYGTTVSTGPLGGGGGVVFKLTPRSGGGWTNNVVHAFVGKPAQHSWANLVLDKAGNLYGTTKDCGKGETCQGVVFEISP